MFTYRGRVKQSWDERVKYLWEAAGQQPEQDFLSAIEDLTSELDASDPRAAFHRACALDYVGSEAEAEPLYRQALEAGLDERTPIDGLRCRLQLASTLRNLGRISEALRVLESIDPQSLSLEHRDWLDAFMALCQASDGDPKGAARTALLALSRHLTEYTQSVPRYARDL